jgi:hypothetical protein
MGQVIAVALAESRKNPRPRWHYFLFSLGFLSRRSAWASPRDGGALHHNGLSRALTETACFAGAGTLVAVARGSFRGRIHRAMWRYPPPWLDNEEAEEAGPGTSNDLSCAPGLAPQTGSTPGCCSASCRPRRSSPAGKSLLSQVTGSRNRGALVARMYSFHRGINRRAFAANSWLVQADGGGQTGRAALELTHVSNGRYQR